MRPLLALRADAAGARRIVPFLALVGIDVDVISWSRLVAGGGGRGPDAVLATEVGLLDGLPDVPTAVWVGDAHDLRRAAELDVEVPLSSGADLGDRGVVQVPPVGVEVARWPVLPPLVRSRWRLRHELPPHLVVEVDHHARTDDAATTLALSAAAVVMGPLVPLALALGTPTVTSRETARRLGLQAGVEVEVAADQAEADDLARELAHDEPRAAALSRRGRRHAEHHLDLGRPATLVRQRLGLVPTPAPDRRSNVIARLDELGTPAGARQRERAFVAIAPFPPIRAAAPAHPHEVPS